jgi:hypothetical protein
VHGVPCLSDRLLFWVYSRTYVEENRVNARSKAKELGEKYFCESVEFLIISSDVRAILILVFIWMICRFSFSFAYLFLLQSLNNIDCEENCGNSPSD